MFGIFLAPAEAAAQHPDFLLPQTPAWLSSLLPSSGEQTHGLLVWFKPRTSAKALASTLQDVGAKPIRSYHFLPRLHLIQIPRGDDPAEVAAQLEADPDVVWVEENRPLKIQTLPNDPPFEDGAEEKLAWGLRDINAPQSWSKGTGSQSNKIAVLDTGIDFTHPDLQDNIWTNPGEIADNGLDDDHNGYVDDVHGWDFVDGDNNPQDEVITGRRGGGHGTHVSGTIAARGNNGIGTAGVNWKASLVPLRICDAGGSCYLDKVISALQYVHDQGIKVSNNSYGGEICSYQALQTAISAIPEHLYIAAAGNSGYNMDSSPECPGGWASSTANILTVAALGQDGNLAWFSNWGSMVGLAAPGIDIYSTLPEGAFGKSGGYGYLSGTSMATPHVVGAAGWLLSLHPSWSADQIKAALLVSVQKTDALKDQVASGGKLDLAAAADLPDDFNQRLLSIKMLGTGDGSLEVNGQEISCQQGCTLSHDKGEQLTISAHGTDGSTFTGWAGACSGTEECVLTLDKNYLLSAQFKQTIAAPGWQINPILAPDGRTAYYPDHNFAYYSFFKNALSQDGQTRALLITNDAITGRDAHPFTRCTDDNLEHAGLAVMQHRTNSGWVTDQTIFPPRDEDMDTNARCERWGYDFAFSANAQTMVIGQTRLTVNQPRRSADQKSYWKCTMYIWTHQQDGWEISGRFVPQDALPGARNGYECSEGFPYSPEISADGQTIVDLQGHFPLDGSNGFDHIWLHTGKQDDNGSWQWSRSELPCDGDCRQLYQDGRRISLSGDGETLVASINGTNNRQGSILVYHWRDGGWQQDDTFSLPGSWDDYSCQMAWGKGDYVSLSPNGQLLVVGSSCFTGGILPDRAGGAVVYKLEDGHFQQKTILHSPRPRANTHAVVGSTAFGYCVPTQTVQRIVCRAIEQVGHQADSSLVYVFDAPEGWDQPLTTQRLIAPDGKYMDWLWLQEPVSMNGDGTELYANISVINHTGLITPTPLYNDPVLGYQWLSTPQRPTVSLQAPAEQTRSGPQDELLFSFQSQEGSQTQCSLDKGDWQPCQSPARYTLSVGKHYFQVRAISPEGILSPAPYPQSVIQVGTSSLKKPKFQNPPPAWNNQTSLQINFQSSDQPDSYLCSLDGAEDTQCQSPYSVQNLEEGNHSFTVQAVGNGGQKSPRAQINWSTDLTPPTPSEWFSLPNRYSSDKWTILSWYSGIDPLGGQIHSGYYYDLCSLDGGSWDECSWNWGRPYMAEGEHSLDIKTVDRAGNQSSTIHYDFGVYRNKPLAQWDLNSLPPEKTNNPHLEYPLTFSHNIQGLSADDFENSGTAKECSFSPDHESGTHFTVQVEGCSDGTIRPLIKKDSVSDPIGNTGPSDPTSPWRETLLDRTIPTGTWQIQTTSHKAQTVSYTLTFSKTSRVAASKSFVNLGSASGCQFTAGGSEWSNSISVTISGCSEGSIIPRLKSGSLLDQFGNGGPESNIDGPEFTIDRTPPRVLSFTTSQASPVRGDIAVSYQIVFSEALSQGSSGDLQPADLINSFGGCTFSQPTTSDRIHFSFQAQNCPEGELRPFLIPYSIGDLSDNYGPAEMTYASPAVQVDKSAPLKPTWDKPPAPFIRSRSLQIPFSGEPGASFLCSRDNKTYVSCSSPQTFSGLDEGSYRLYVRQTDRAGNQGPVDSVSWSVDLTAPSLAQLALKRVGSRLYQIKGRSSERIQIACRWDNKTSGCKLGSKILFARRGKQSLVLTLSDRAGNQKVYRVELMVS